MTNTRTLLIVEDDDDFRTEMQRLLKSRGYEIHSARNGAEALALLSGMKHPCTVLVDIVMPGMDGWELITAIRALGKGQESPHKIIIISGSGAAQGIAKLEGVGCLTKPFTPAELLRCLEQTEVSAH